VVGGKYDRCCRIDTVTPAWPLVWYGGQYLYGVRFRRILLTWTDRKPPAMSGPSNTWSPTRSVPLRQDRGPITAP
jgi:hypothetical protein